MFRHDNDAADDDSKKLQAIDMVSHCGEIY